MFFKSPNGFSHWIEGDVHMPEGWVEIDANTASSLPQPDARAAKAVHFDQMRLTLIYPCVIRLAADGELIAPVPLEQFFDVAKTNAAMQAARDAFAKSSPEPLQPKRPADQADEAEVIAYEAAMKTYQEAHVSWGAQMAAAVDSVEPVYSYPEDVVLLSDPLPDCHVGSTLVFEHGAVAARELTPIVKPPPAPKMVGVEFQGLMCSATGDDQVGLLAIWIDWMSEPDSFKPTVFRFSNGTELVLTKDNIQRFMAVWRPFRRSFFEPKPKQEI